MKRRPVRNLLAAVLLLILGMSIVRTVLPFFGTFLLVEDNLQKADAIVALRGEDEFFRFKKAVELYNQGYAPAIIVSIPLQTYFRHKDYYDFRFAAFGAKEISGEQITLNEFAYFGKKPDGILITPYEASSTYDEALAARAVMEKAGLKSVILVTSTYHMRRALTIFRHVFRGSGIQVYWATGTNDFYSPAKWWEGEKDFRRVGEEYISGLANFIRYGFRETSPVLALRKEESPGP